MSFVTLTSAGRLEFDLVLTGRMTVSVHFQGPTARKIEFNCSSLPFAQTWKSFPGDNTFVPEGVEGTFVNNNVLDNSVGGAKHCTIDLKFSNSTPPTDPTLPIPGSPADETVSSDTGPGTRPRLRTSTWQFISNGDTVGIIVVMEDDGAHGQKSKLAAARRKLDRLMKNVLKAIKKVRTAEEKLRIARSELSTARKALRTIRL